jgi:endonuclease YncB( thermonuclease family)
VIRKPILATLAAAAFHSFAAQPPIADVPESANSRTPESAAVVAWVLDGDTMILEGSRDRIRLADIDAPEMGHGYGRPSQPFAAQAKKWMKEKVEGKRVVLRCPDEDKYGRRVCVLFLNGENVNKSLVQAGLAWANTARPQYLRDQTILDAQRQAQAARAGLWTQARPIAPWVWRWECREKASCGS